MYEQAQRHDSPGITVGVYDQYGASPECRRRYKEENEHYEQSENSQDISRYESVNGRDNVIHQHCIGGHKP